MLREVVNASINSRILALAGVAQLVEHHPMYQKLAGLIASQGTYPGCLLRPQ